ncbi:HD-GYP domain-containing protein [Ornithinimicrobium pratense]|uniref:HD domain-containing protein n=1 Tax=Ornithinimicrobium pratense TaxID=2593973 RepID=A0A5J6V818_9MICO|nr:HD domain-containing phosphohydrolase [Ornithinimicrobium pratense]QFG69152.1 HD domain-containing protein [Ornithinimicrobium pratense]
MSVVILIFALATIAFAAGWWGWLWVGATDQVEVRVLVPLGLLGILGVVLRERALGPHLGVSLGMVVLAAAIPLAGPHGAALVGLVSFIADYRQRDWRAWLFNAAMTAAVGGVGGLTYVALGGAVGAQAADLRGPALLTQVGVPLLVAYAVMTLTNVLALGVMSALMRGTRVLDFAWRALQGVGWGYLTHVVIGFLFVVLWGPARLETVAAVFVLGPLFIAHWAIGREALARREHQETVATFVAALEQSDASTAGHSARVATLAEALGGVIGIHGKAAEALRYAALLHDIGLVAARSWEPDDIDEASYLTALSTHADAGVEVLRGLDFLAEAAPGIAHHHERWDGRGYPAGLAGEDIPQAARVIAVADAFDALTVAPEGARLTAQEALVELEGRAGTQLDPVVVEALCALANRPRGLPVPEPTQPAPDAPARALPDHDHPLISDAFAQWQPESIGRPL